MSVANTDLLTSLLHQLPARSPRHSLILTIWLLAQNSNKHEDERTLKQYWERLRNKKWSIDQSTVRWLIQNGDEHDRFNLLSSSIRGFIPRPLFDTLWRRCFEERRRNEYSMSWLSDLIMARLIGDEFRDAARFKKEIQILVNHRSTQVRGRALWPAIFLDPPVRNHFRMLLKGLSHADDKLRMECVNALEMLLETGRRRPVSAKALKIISTLNFRAALQKMAKSNDLSGNAKVVLALLDRHGI